MSIHNRTSAKALWKMFYKKYPHPANSVQFPSRDVHRANEFSSFKNANFMDAFTPNIFPSHTLDNADPMGKSLPAHKAKKTTQLNKTIDKLKLNSLQGAIENGDWYHKIFQDKSVLELAFALFYEGTITYQQYCSVLERVHYKEMKDVLVYPIVDQKGEFTSEASTILWPALRDHFYLQAPNEEQLQELKLLIATLPLSEQFFYCATPSLQENRNHRNHNKTTRMDHSLLAYIDSIHINLTAGARDAFGLSRFGLNDYEPSEPNTSSGILSTVIARSA